MLLKTIPWELMADLYSWWRHQMETFSALLALCAGNSPVPGEFPLCVTFVRGIHRSPVNSPHKGQWRGALMFPLICTWINDWVNNREAGDLRRHRAHYDVSVMWFRHQSAAIFAVIKRSEIRNIKSPATRRFIQLFALASIKETSKLSVTGPLWGEFTGDRWIPRTKDQ